ncbi:hypothetical protein TNIN_207911 [Trichonephila inaurata madagascariensis]|uniref:Uncharacterized protein n=1 Tax=Trichonephila inaurata madagascariensis TaxID=2747483 RepID=A0A8X6WRB4_9ARAC|nr:hypothetical protein TNIN_207911 [Trichonephila inaurata madagascariensis]
MPHAVCLDAEWEELFAIGTQCRRYFRALFTTAACLGDAEDEKALDIFEELPSDNDLAASNNTDTDDEVYIENFAQEKNIYSDDGEIDEIQFTSQPELKWGKLYKKNIDILRISRKSSQNRRWPVQEMLSLQYQKRRSSLSIAVSVQQRITMPSSKWSYLL